MSEIGRRAVVVGLGSGIASVAAAGTALVWAHSANSPSRERGATTSFGSVALLGSSRLALAARGAAHHAHAHGRPGKEHEVSGTPVPSAVHGAWTDAAVVDVEVHNSSQTPRELSPGQFRVRVDGGGPTVSLYSADRDAGPVEPGSTTRLRISYLVPPPDRGLSLEFADTGAAAPVRLGRVGHQTEELS